MINKLFNMDKFTLECIKIANVDTTENFLDGNINKQKVYRNYIFNKESVLQRITLFENYTTKEYEAKYFLQDIAYTYKMMNEDKNDLLMFMETIKHEEQNIIKIFAISSYDCFNPNLRVEIEIKLNETGGLANEIMSLNKIKNILNNGDFTSDRIMILSDKKYDFMDTLFNNSKLRMESMQYMSKKDMKSLFKNTKPFVQSHAMARYLISSCIVFTIGLGVLTQVFEASSYMESLHENKISNFNSQTISKKEELKQLRIKQEKLFMENSKKMISFIPGKDEV